MSRLRTDMTLERTTIEHRLFLIKEVNLIKHKAHPRYRFLEEFYKVHGLNRQSFIKFYNRYTIENQESALLPQKRGPRYKTRRTSLNIEKEVIALRQLGNNRYEIHQLLKQKFKQASPSPSTIYRIFKRYGYHQLTQPMKQSHQKIIKEKAGDLGHIDCCYLSKGMIDNDPKRYYLVGLIDDCTRLAQVEIVPNIKGLTVMFSLLRLLNKMNIVYQIQFTEILSDNGPEFGRKTDKNLSEKPVPMLLAEMDIKHRFTKPYRPQTNGKIERFWKTLKIDLIEGTVFDSMEHFKQELEEYLYYYNHLRPHQGIGAKTPVEFNNNLK
jgi:hypothetical protein